MSKHTTKSNVKYEYGAWKQLRRDIKHERVLAASVLFYMLGAIIGASFTFSGAVFFALAAVGLLGYFFFREWRPSGLFLLIAVMFVGMGISCQAINSTADVTPGSHVVAGTVKDISPKDNGTTMYTLSDVKVDGEEIHKNAFLTSSESYTLDDIITSDASVSLPNRARYSFGFDDRLYCASKGAAFRAYSSGDELTGRAVGVLPWANSLRLEIAEKMDALFGENAGVAKAFVLGVDWDIYDDSYETFRMAGISHLLSVSGLHVGFMAGALLILLRKLLRLGRTSSYLATLAFLAFYVIFTGGRVPVVRASIMFACYIIAKLSGRRADRPTILAVALFINLIGNPLRLFDVGLQLSFGAVFSLMCVEPAISRLFGEPRSKLARGAIASFAINLGTLPIMINLNNNLWPMTIVVNAVAVIVASVAIPMSALATLIYVILGDAALFIGKIPDFLIDILNVLADIYNKTPNLSFSMHSTYGAAALMVFALAYFISPYAVKIKRKIRYGAVSALAVIIAALYVLPTINTAPLRITFLDIGSQDATIVETADRTLLIDAGQNERAAEYLIKNGVTPYAVIVTDQSAEYAYGITNVAKEFTSAKIYSSISGQQILEMSGVEAEALETGESIVLSKDVRVRVLNSVGDNLDSLVLSVDYYGRTALLYLSDAKASEQYGINQKSDIVKLAGHGAKDYFNAETLQNSGAAAVVVCSQRELSQYVKENLSDVELYQTKYNGSITAVWSNNEEEPPEIKTMYGSAEFGGKV